jgi:hypothetical protein
MQRLALTAALTTALAILAFTAGGRGLVAERPYEEALYRVAVQSEAPMGQLGGGVWSEHPPLAYPLLDTSRRLVGPGIESLRLVWTAFFLLGFCLTLRFAWANSQLTSGWTKEDLLRAAIVLSAFASPLLLVRATRVGPDAPSCALLALVLVAGGRFLSAPGCHSALAFGTAAAGLAFMHAYGPLVSVSLVAVAAVALVRSLRRPGTVAALIIVGAAVAIPLVLMRHDLGARLRTLTDHYWAQAVVFNSPGAPLAGIWYAGSELTVDGGHLVDLLQGASIGLLVLVVAAGKDSVSRWAAGGALACVAGFWVWERVAGGEVVIPHWLGPVWLLGFAAVARGLSGRPLAAAAAGAVGTVLLPGLASVLLMPGSGPACLKRAAEEIEQSAGPTGTVVFGGTRAYILLVPELDPSVVDRSSVYFRGEPSPDSFVGRQLIPTGRLIPDHQWPGRLTADRVVVVRLEAAQKVEIPNTGWTVLHRRRFVHPANSVGEITVEVWQRAK